MDDTTGMIAARRESDRTGGNMSLVSLRQAINYSERHHSSGRGGYEALCVLACSEELTPHELIRVTQLSWPFANISEWAIYSMLSFPIVGPGSSGTNRLSDPFRTEVAARFAAEDPHGFEEVHRQLVALIDEGAAFCSWSKDGSYASIMAMYHTAFFDPAAALERLRVIQQAIAEGSCPERRLNGFAKLIDRAELIGPDAIAFQRALAA